MGVTHSMEEAQVKRISKALNASANAIQGINNKFEAIDVHVQRMMEFNKTTNEKMDAAFRSFERLDDTFNDRAEMFLEAVVGATNSATDCLEAAVLALQKVNIRQEIDNIPKALIPLAIPFIILLIELAVSNAYLGILLASLPSVSLRYSNYLLAYASSTLLGLFLSLTWLVCYRVWLSVHSSKTSTEAQTVELLRKLRTRSGTTQSLDSDALSHTSEPSVERQATLDSVQLESSGSVKEHRRPARESIARVRARREQRRIRRTASREHQGLADDGSWKSPQISAGASPDVESTLTSPHRSPLLTAASPVDMGSDDVRSFLDSQAEFTQAVPSEAGAAFRMRGRTRSTTSIRSRGKGISLEDTRPPQMPVPQEQGQWRNAVTDVAEWQDTGRWSPDEVASASSPASVNVDKGSTEKRSGMVQTRWERWENPFGMKVTWGRRQATAPSSPPPPAPGEQQSSALVLETSGREGTDEFDHGEHLHL